MSGKGLRFMGVRCEIKEYNTLKKQIQFNVSPKVPNPGGGYTLRATIVKGQRTSLDQSKWNEKASMPSKCCSTEKSFSAGLYRKKPSCQGKNWN